MATVNDAFVEELMGFVMLAGDARSSAMEGIKIAKEHDFEKAEALLDNANKAMLDAHHAHAKLLARDAQGELPLCLLLIHAEDQLMAASTVIDLASEIIELHKAIQD
mgnify:FL=1